MPKDTKTEAPRYKLTEDESNNLKGREQFSGYLQDLIQRDIAMYLANDIYKRLGITKDQKAEISEDREWITVAPRIIMPDVKN
jgi:hypothetical protein